MKLSKKAQAKIWELVEIYSDRIRAEEEYYRRAHEEPTEANQKEWINFLKSNIKFEEEFKEFLANEI